MLVKDGHEHGDKRAATLQREHIVKLMAARAEKPDSANGLRKALRAMMRHAVEIGLRADDPTRDVKALRPKSKLGFHRWTEKEIALFEARHPIGIKPRLALALGLYTGQARLDVVAMGPQHIESEVLCWVRGKTERTTGIELSISGASDVACDHRCNAERPSDAPDYRTGRAVHCGRIRKLVPRAVRHGQSSPLLVPWIAQGCIITTGGSRMHAARDRGDHRTCQPERDRPIHSNRGPKAARRGGHGEGESENIQCQT
jgi:hypothetical protein